MGGKLGWKIWCCMLALVASTVAVSGVSPAAVPPPGTIDTVAGGFGIDSGIATDLHLNLASRIAYGDGQIDIADRNNYRVRAVDIDNGTFTTVAGYGAGGQFFGGATLPATTSRIPAPYGIGTNDKGTVVLTSIGPDVVLEVDTEQSTIEHRSGRNPQGYFGDGGAAPNARLANPEDVAIDGDGNLFIADADNHVIRRIDAATDIITTVAGTGTAGDGPSDVLATTSALNGPSGVAIDDDGNVYIADQGNHRIRMLATDGTITNIAGTGASGPAVEGVSAASATFSSPSDVAVDSDGNVYVADENNEITLWDYSLNPAGFASLRRQILFVCQSTKRLGPW